MIHRRNLLVGLSATSAAIAAPAIVRYASIMPVRALDVTDYWHAWYPPYSFTRWDEIKRNGFGPDGDDVIVTFKNGVLYFSGSSYIDDDTGMRIWI